MTMKEDVFEFADRFLVALEGSDPEAVRRFYAPDARLWHNFDDLEQSVDDNLKVFSWMARKLPKKRYRVLRRERLPDGWMQQHVIEAQLPDGRPFRLHACAVLKLRDGLIVRLDEYLDPAQAAVLSSIGRPGG